METDEPPELPSPIALQQTVKTTRNLPETLIPFLKLGILIIETFEQIQATKDKETEILRYCQQVTDSRSLYTHSRTCFLLVQQQYGARWTRCNRDLYGKMRFVFQRRRRKTKFNRIMWKTLWKPSSDPKVITSYLQTKVGHIKLSIVLIYLHYDF